MECTYERDAEARRWGGAVTTGFDKPARLFGDLARVSESNWVGGCSY